MNLYLVQHGEAKPKAEDPSRPLSDRGAGDVSRMAVWSAQTQLNVNQIRHSGKKRAEQTAELFAEKLKPSSGVIAVAGMDPKDSVKPIADVLNQEEGNIMLVGHLPFLNRLASHLVIKDPEMPLLRFHNAGIVCLSRDEDKWTINWSIGPELL